MAAITPVNLMVWGGGAAALAVFVAMGAQKTEENRAAVIQRFAITETEWPMMQACETVMVGDRIKFKSGVDEIPGCACMTRHVQDQLEKGENAYATALLPKLIAFTVKKHPASGGDAEIRQLARTHRVSDRRADLIADSIVEAVGACSSSTAYMTDAEIVAADEADTQRRARSKAAIEDMVARGSMTREKADDVIARLK